MRLDGCNALVTGASAGIGREFARLLAERARSLVLVARRRDRLEALRDELKTHHPDLIVHVRAADLSDLTQVRELVESLEGEGVPIDLLINNAGLGDMGSFSTSDCGRVEQMLLVNALALTVLTRECLPQMLVQKHQL